MYRNIQKKTHKLELINITTAQTPIIKIRKLKLKKRKLV